MEYFYAVDVLIMIIAVFLILFVLMQRSKGGGAASGFSSSNQVMGVKKTNDLLERITWGLAISVLVLSALSTRLADRTGQGERIKSINERMMEENGDMPTQTTNPENQQQQQGNE